MIKMTDKKVTPYEAIYNEKIISVLVAFCVLCLFSLRGSPVLHPHFSNNSYNFIFLSELFFTAALPMLVFCFLNKVLNLSDRTIFLKLKKPIILSPVSFFRMAVSCAMTGFFLLIFQWSLYMGIILSISTIGSLILNVLFEK